MNILEIIIAVLVLLNAAVIGHQFWREHKAWHLERRHDHEINQFRRWKR